METIIYYKNRDVLETSRKEDGSRSDRRNTVWPRTCNVLAPPERAPRRHSRRKRPPGKRLDGRKGPLSTIINLRLLNLPGTLLDRYIDRLESHTGLKASSWMLARRALELFLETHEAS